MFQSWRYIAFLVFQEFEKSTASIFAALSLVQGLLEKAPSPPDQCKNECERHHLLHELALEALGQNSFFGMSI